MKIMGQRYLPQIVVPATLVAVWCLGVALLLGALNVSAQKLSLRHYDVPDGLAHGTVQAIHQDAKGYLWFGTFEGLSREMWSSTRSPRTGKDICGLVPTAVAWPA
jgi:ligand-binding sensor domain-containing protein